MTFRRTAVLFAKDSLLQTPVDKSEDNVRPVARGNITAGSDQNLAEERYQSGRSKKSRRLAREVK
jgi:hypothetical protein